MRGTSVPPVPRGCGLRSDGGLDPSCVLSAASVGQATPLVPMRGHVSPSPALGRPVRSYRGVAGRTCAALPPTRPKRSGPGARTAGDKGCGPFPSERAHAWGSLLPPRVGVPSAAQGTLDPVCPPAVPFGTPWGRGRQCVECPIGGSGGPARTPGVGCGSRAARGRRPVVPGLESVPCACPVVATGPCAVRAHPVYRLSGCTPARYLGTPGVGSGRMLRWGVRR